MRMYTKKTTERIAYIANCKCCGRNGIEIPESYKEKTIKCPACGYIIEKKEWQGTKPDQI